jgi:hypothetical protein
MRPLLAIAVILSAMLLVGAAVGLIRYRQAFPAPSEEVVRLDAQKRAALANLKAESKFGPHSYPPLGYTGAATPEDKLVATSAVNGLIDGVLAHSDGPIAARDVSRLIAKALRRVEMLETEDRDRAGDYMIEVWYLLGFHEATGRFAHGSAFPRWPSYAEPLPPGWKSPTEPRPIG